VLRTTFLTLCRNAADTCMTVSGFRPSSAKMLFLDRL